MKSRIYRILKPTLYSNKIYKQHRMNISIEQNYFGKRSKNNLESRSLTVLSVDSMMAS